MLGQQEVLQNERCYPGDPHVEGERAPGGDGKTVRAKVESDGDLRMLAQGLGEMVEARRRGSKPGETGSWAPDLLQGNGSPVKVESRCVVRPMTPLWRGEMRQGRRQI